MHLEFSLCLIFFFVVFTASSNQDDGSRQGRQLPYYPVFDTLVSAHHRHHFYPLQIWPTVTETKTILVTTITSNTTTRITWTPTVTDPVNTISETVYTSTAFFTCTRNTAAGSACIPVAARKRRQSRPIILAAEWDDDEQFPIAPSAVQG